MATTKDHDECCAPEGACCAFDPDRLVMGGQGRSPAEIERSANIVGLVLTWTFFFFCGLLVGMVAL